MTLGFGDLLGSGRALIGTWVKMPALDGVELLAAAGFDFLVLDMEHSPLDSLTVHQLLGAARGCAIPALVRVPDRGPSTIARVLDSGAAGVLIPHVDTVAQTRDVVSAARFPPLGTRGYGPTVRAGGWGFDPDHYRDSAGWGCVVPQLESEDAVAAVHDIAAVPGLGALFVGPADLSVATGLPAGSTGFAGLLADVERTARETGVPLGTAVGTAAAARDLVDRYDFVLVGNDASMLGAAARGVVEELRGSASAPLAAPGHRARSEES